MVTLVLVGLWVAINYDGLERNLGFNPSKNIQQFDNSKWKNEPNRLEIPSLDVVGKIEYPTTIDDMNANLDRAINHYPGTAEVGTVGNVVLTAHSSSIVPGYYSNIFATINRLNVADPIIIYRNNNKYTYNVVESREIEASDTAYVNSHQDGKYLTLLTCWPLGTDWKRLAVTAEETE